MKRNSLSGLTEKWPFAAQVLWECSFCHAIGLRPGILAAYKVNPTVQRLLSKYQELPLNKLGLCATCSDLVSESEKSPDLTDRQLAELDRRATDALKKPQTLQSQGNAVRRLKR
jgi:hypothetical protein